MRKHVLYICLIFMGAVIAQQEYKAELKQDLFSKGYLFSKQLNPELAFKQGY